MDFPIVGTDSETAPAEKLSGAETIPGGTVTFLFTDIEGSTRLWEQYPEAMRPALARHDALLRHAIEENGGYIFKLLGDAFCAAFATAAAALQAALDGQRVLCRETWPEAISLRVRMALHTGAVESRSGDYFGPPLNRTARMLDAGHGGQVLLSLATEELVRDTLPLDCSLQDKGMQQLRDLSRPETVYQLLHPDLPADFAPLRSLNNPEMPNNLPGQLTSFVGREKQISEVADLLSKTRLLTLTGSGGCGKTRLALQVAANALDQYPEGAWLVELAPLSEAIFTPQAVAAVVGVREQTGKTLTQSLTEALKTRRLLLVLDNCEHLLSAVAELAETLLRACPQVRILVSSREGLNVAGELTYRVPSMSLPDVRRARNASAESLRQYEAVRLFVERAAFHRPAFAVTRQNAPALAQLCVQLDGIPLAIELAAARVKALSVEEIGTRLDDRFRLLTGGSRTALPRQQTLRALIDWSYDLLNGQERLLLHRLSVFAGSWTLTAAEKVCSGVLLPTGGNVEEADTLDLISSLVDKSLALEETTPGGGATRYRLLETVRQYARERLVETGETDVLRERFLHWSLESAEEAAPQLTGPDQAIWFERVEAEYDNLRSALEISDPTSALRLAASLVWFWFVRGYHAEGREHARQSLLKDTFAVPTQARARVLTGLAVLAAESETADTNALTALYTEALEIQRTIDDTRGQCIVLNNLGNLARTGCRWADATARYEEALEVARRTGFERGAVLPTFNLGYIAQVRGQYEEAQQRYEAALALSRETGVRSSECETLQQMGLLALDNADIPAAKASLEAGLALTREIGFRPCEAAILLGLATIAQSGGDYSRAQSLQEEALRIGREIGQPTIEAEAVLGKAALCLAQGQMEAARIHLVEAWNFAPLQTVNDPHALPWIETALLYLVTQNSPVATIRLTAFAQSQRAAFEMPLPPARKAEQDLLLASCRTLLGSDAAFAAVWDEGSRLPAPEAFGQARSALESSGSISGKL